MTDKRAPLAWDLQNTFFDSFKDQDDLHCSLVAPSPLHNPVMVSSNSSLAVELGLNPESVNDPEMLRLMAGDFSGAQLQPIALVYSGHQFGVWAGQLGDGRAMTLGELPVHNSNSGKSQLWDIQLKGAGATPYSRFADGRAVLRSSIREYLCSEAMHSLGIATTRALCLVTSETPVYREEVESARNRLSGCSPAIFALARLNIFIIVISLRPLKLWPTMRLIDTFQNGLKKSCATLTCFTIPSQRQPK